MATLDAITVPRLRLLGADHEHCSRLEQALKVGRDRCRILDQDGGLFFLQPFFDFLGIEWPSVNTKAFDIGNRETLLRDLGGGFCLAPNDHRQNCQTLGCWQIQFLKLDVWKLHELDQAKRFLDFDARVGLQR